MDLKKEKLLKLRSIRGTFFYGIPLDYFDEEPVVIEPEEPEPVEPEPEPVIDTEKEDLKAQLAAAKEKLALLDAAKKMEEPEEVEIVPDIPQQAE